MNFNSLSKDTVRLQISMNNILGMQVTENNKVTEFSDRKLQNPKQSLRSLQRLNGNI